MNEKSDGAVVRIILLGDPSDEGLLHDLLGRAAVRHHVTRVTTTEHLMRALEDAQCDMTVVRATCDPIEALRVWRTTALQTPFILLTVPGSEEIAAACAKEGALVLRWDAVADVRSLLPGFVSSTADRHEQLANRAGNMDAVATLASRAAHEVKNPLTVILMGIDFLGRYLKDSDPEVLGILRDMEGAVKRANSVLRDLIDLAAAGSLEMKSESIGSMIEETLTPMSTQLSSKGIRVVRDLDPTLPLVRIDRSRMITVLRRVLRNAIRRLPNGGDVRVRASSLRNAAGDAVDKGVVVLEVEDNGPPPSETDLARIFDPLLPSDATEGETNPELPLTREIVRLHGGVIIARNREGGDGLRVSISLRGEGQAETGADLGDDRVH